MAEEQLHEIRASDLPIALYLNQRVTFDLLASLEDGFAHMTTVAESSTEERNSGIQGNAGLGISNGFAFLGLGFGGAGHRESASESSDVTTEELVHTPTSLFARLRQELIRRGLVRTIESDDQALTGVAAGDFVEVQAVLRRSPLITLLSSVRRLVPVMEAFEQPATQPQGGGRSGRRRGSGGATRTSQLMKQLDTFLNAVTVDGSEDLIAQCGANRFVLTAETTYFVDPTLNDVIDGTFRIFGKVTRVVPAGEDDGISLLRRSPMGDIGGFSEQLESSFSSLPDSGFTGEKVETEIPAPTLQMIPIGIFA